MFNKNNKNNFKNAIKVSLLYSMIFGSSVAISDDIEIYSSSTESTNFNLLFMTDTSGSMGIDSRMTDMKTALKSVISNMNDKVNVGIGRFSDVAGVVTEPVLPLNKISNYLTEKSFVKADASQLGATVQVNNNELGIKAMKVKSSTGGDGYVALQMDVGVPSNVEVYGSKLTLYPALSNSSKVLIEVSAEVGAPSNLGGSISNYPLSTVKESFTVDWIKGEVVELDISSLLKEKFSESDWCEKNDLNLILKFIDQGDGDVYMYAEESNKFKSHLKINYLPFGNSCTVPEDKNMAIFDSKDDAEEDRWGYVYRNFYQLLLDGYDGYSRKGWLALRFDEQPVLDGTVRELYLNLTQESINGYYQAPITNVRIYGEKRTSSQRIYTTMRNISSRRRTAAYVDWSIPKGSDGDTFTSPNLVNIYNELKNQYGWNEDSPITFIVENRSITPIAFVAAYGGFQNAPSVKFKLNGKSYLPAIAPIKHKDILMSEIDKLNASGSTPLQGQQIESYFYLKGENVGYGQYAYPIRITNNYSIPGVKSNVKAIDPGYESEDKYWLKDDPDGRLKYESPLGKRSCDINALVMLTDGVPTGSLFAQNPDNGRTMYDEFESITGKQCDPNDYWQCSLDLASHMYNNDLMPDKPGLQNVLTYTIGMDLNQTYKLPDLAKAGGGSYYDASNAEDLKEVFTKILTDVYDKAASVVVPGISVSQTSKYLTKDELYYALFKPSASPIWKGNLKRYRLDTTGSIVQGEGAVIVDSNNKPAIDKDTLFFSDDAKSFWSTSIDGNVITKGGAVGKISSFRKMYTAPANAPKEYLFTNDDLIESGSVNVTAASYNAAINTNTLGKLNEWVRGVDVLDENFNGNVSEMRRSMGAVLHSRPLVVNYTNTDSTIFVSTTDGVLHAVDSATGNEIFSFMPSELLDDAYKRYLYEQDPTNNSISSMQYGLDSPWVAYRNDVDKDGKIEKADGDFVYLYGGMRRGGSSYFALDVTDVYASSGSMNVKLKFVLNPTKNFGLRHMGQSWSVPVLSKVKIGNNEKVVLIFGGGYDVSNDAENYLQNGTTTGAMVYMVDAVTGDLLWRAGSATTWPTLIHNDIKYSITASISPVDINGDGLMDSFYVGDLGGQIFRFDIENGNPINTLVKAKTIARLGVSRYPSLSGQRRFYERIVNVPMMVNGVKTMGLAIGSGYRSHPLNKATADAFFLIYDKEVFNKSSSMYSITTPIDISKLAGLTFQLNESTAASAASNKMGYYIYLISPNYKWIGEKVLSEASVINDEITFSTYVPGVSANSCSPAIGETRNYKIKLYSGVPVDDEDSNLERSDRYSSDVRSGMGGGTKTLFTENGAVNIGGTKVETVDMDIMMGAQRSTWRQLDQIETNNYKSNKLGL